MKSKLVKRNIIRPKIFVPKRDLEICLENTQWDEMLKTLKQLSKTQYNNFMTEIETHRKDLPKLFYKKLDNVIKFRNNTKIVRRISVNDKVLSVEESNEFMKNYSENLFNRNQVRRFNNRSKNQNKYDIDFDRAIQELHVSKATGVD